MCSNYEPITANDRLLATYGVEAPHADFKVEAWPLGQAPFIRLSEEGATAPALGYLLGDLMPDQVAPCRPRPLEVAACRNMHTP